jgi:hypothetical protein
MELSRARILALAAIDAVIVIQTVIYGIALWHFW